MLSSAVTSDRSHRLLGVSFSLALLGCGAVATPVVTDRALVIASSPVMPRRAEIAAELRPRVELAGTGVSLVPPVGATPTPFGAGFLGAERELEVIIALAQDEATFDEIVRFGAAGEEREVEQVVIDGRAVHLVVDRTSESGERIERVWFFVRDGARGLAVLGEYDAATSARLREPMRQSLLSTRWNVDAVIDPERAAGYRVDAPEGLVPVTEVVSGVTYTLPGQPVALASGRPTLLVAPLGIEVPQPEQATDCDLLLLTAGPVPYETVVDHHVFQNDRVAGCELFGREEAPVRSGESIDVATYAAIVFLDDEAFLVTGITEASGAGVWTPMFATAARSLSVAQR